MTRYAMRDIHNQADIMFNQHDGGALQFVYVENETRHILFFFNVHARHRLVQKQQRRFQRQGASQLDALAQPITQGANYRFADTFQFQKIDDLFNTLPVRNFFPCAGPQNKAPVNIFDFIWICRAAIKLSSTVALV